ncbi:MAG: hypothetical protein WC928_01200 [Patescibacteria group bacterium]|jgi:hypothetical protein
MTLKKYFFSIGLLTLFLWALFIFLALIINPETSDWVGFVFFYSSLFLALSGTIIIIGFNIRKKQLQKNLAFYLVKTSFRQAFLFSLLITATLFMLAENLFSWLNILILILILSITEYILINNTK